ncbi:hypothetical protein FB45DRAFT_861958 [Roridomyces roridus]|uniref:Uncharacterized protein n=1 Tax=Roridomyces roridus TaxID=1738132 RepID=A0AAD7CCJ4_9AGAR|nr:hypothetical protein FB45DRAFT_861958 [Roridomyces roridus]
MLKYTIIEPVRVLVPWIAENVLPREGELLQQFAGRPIDVTVVAGFIDLQKECNGDAQVDGRLLIFWIYRRRVDVTETKAKLWLISKGAVLLIGPIALLMMMRPAIIASGLKV